MHNLTGHVKRKISQLSQNSYFRAGLAIIISAVTLILSVRNVAFQDIWSALAKSDSRYVWLTLASVVANNLAKTIRWKVLFGDSGQKVSLWVIFKALLVGQTLNLIYPARIGDLSRIYIVGDRGAGRAFTLGTIIVEKILDTLFYALLVLMLVLLIPLPAWMGGWANKSVVVLISASLGATILLMVIAYHPAWIIKSLDSLVGFASKRFPRLNLLRALDWVHSGVSSLEILKSGKGLIYVTIWLVVSWVTALLNNHLALLALGIHLPLTASLLVLIVLQAGISIPSVPGRIGVFEYICVLTLAGFGISQAVALTYGVLLHSIVFIPPTLLGLFFIVQLGLPIRRVGWAESSKENH